MRLVRKLGLGRADVIGILVSLPLGVFFVVIAVMESRDPLFLLLIVGVIVVGIVGGLVLGREVMRDLRDKRGD